MCSKFDSKAIISLEWAYFWGQVLRLTHAADAGFLGWNFIFNNLGIHIILEAHLLLKHKFNLLLEDVVALLAYFWAAAIGVQVLHEELGVLAGLKHQEHLLELVDHIDIDLELFKQFAKIFSNLAELWRNLFRVVEGLFHFFVSDAEFLGALFW